MLEIEVGAEVRLTEPWHDLPAGATGHVAVKYLRPAGEHAAVQFDGLVRIVPTRLLAPAAQASDGANAAVPPAPPDAV